MKKILIAIALLLSFNAFADTYVRGYTKQNGTYVEPHYRSSPNGLDQFGAYQYGAYINDTCDSANTQP